MIWKHTQNLHMCQNVHIHQHVIALMYQFVFMCQHMTMLRTWMCVNLCSYSHIWLHQEIVHVWTLVCALTCDHTHIFICVQMHIHPHTWPWLKLYMCEQFLEVCGYIWNYMWVNPHKYTTMLSLVAYMCVNMNILTTCTVLRICSLCTCAYVLTCDHAHAC